MASKKPVLNNTPRPATQSTRPGSITVTVTVGGDGVGVLRNASISVYKYIATPGATGCTGFSPDSWTPPQSTKPPRVERAAPKVVTIVVLELLARLSARGFVPFGATSWYWGYRPNTLFMHLSNYLFLKKVLFRYKKYFFTLVSSKRLIHSFYTGYRIRVNALTPCGYTYKKTNDD